jgi:hypothetical protein
MTTLTRRQFSLRSFATLALSSASFALLAGCPFGSVTQSQIVELIAEVGAGLQEILPYLKSVSASEAATIYAAFQTLETDVQNWKPGGAIAVIEQAVNAFVSAMNLVPVLAEYQPLVALIVATVEGLIALIAPGSTPPPPATGVTRNGRRGITYKGVTFPNPPTTASSFRSSWNKQVSGQPKLAGLTIS